MDLQSALVKVGILALQNDDLSYQNQQLQSKVTSATEEAIQFQSELNEAVEAAVANAEPQEKAAK